MSRANIDKDFSNLASEIISQIGDAVEEYKKEFDVASEETAKELVEILKEKSPKRTGKYARAWTYDDTTNSMLGGGKVFTVHNAQKGNKTYLLEYGWVKSNQYGTYGRQPGIPHIEPAAEEAIEIFQKKAEEIINE